MKTDSHGKLEARYQKGEEFPISAETSADRFCSFSGFLRRIGWAHQSVFIVSDLHLLLFLHRAPAAMTAADLGSTSFSASSLRIMQGGEHLHRHSSSLARHGAPPGMSPSRRHRDSSAAADHFSFRQHHTAGASLEKDHLSKALKAVCKVFCCSAWCVRAHWVFKSIVRHLR